jgi:1,4-dihydroxy-2-naphthoyl-CoA synthase
VTEKGGALNAAKLWAEKVAALPPIPVRMTKEAVNMSAGALALPTSFMDRDQYLLTARSADFKEGAAAFFEKRKGEFRGDYLAGGDPGERLGLHMDVAGNFELGEFAHQEAP